MNVPAELSRTFEELLRAPMGESNPLRDEVATFLARVREGAQRGELDVDLTVPEQVAASLENMLKRVSRKTTPLHHRLIHASARLCTMGPEQGRALDDARFRQDVVVVNEAARVIRRPEVAIALRR